jgi:hypothetical protein
MPILTGKNARVNFRVIRAGKMSLRRATFAPGGRE